MTPPQSNSAPPAVSTRRKANVGSGGDYRPPGEGWLNVERYRDSGHHTGETQPPDVYADAHALPFQTGSLEHVRLAHVLEHLERPLAALNEARRVLEDGGTLYVEVPHAQHVPRERREHLYSWTPWTLRNIVRRAGFIIDEYDDAPKEYPNFSSHVHWINAHRPTRPD